MSLGIARSPRVTSRQLTQTQEQPPALVALSAPWPVESGNGLTSGSHFALFSELIGIDDIEFASRRVLSR